MRILYFHQHFSLPSGMTGTRSYAFARALIARGHQVTMVCGHYDNSVTALEGPFTHNIRRGRAHDIDIVEISVPYSNKMSFPRRVLQFLKFALISSRLAITEPYDLLFATSTPLTVGLPAITGKLLRRRPMIFEVRDLWPDLPKAMGVITNPLILALMSGLEWASYHAADHIVALSPGMVKGVGARGIASDRISMIPNGCDLELFGVAGDDQITLPAGIGSGDFVAVFTGAHGIANGLEAVIAAGVELKRRGNDKVKLLLIGDGRRKTALMAAAAAENLDNVIFMDPVPKTQLAALLARVDLGMMILSNIPAFYYGTSPNKFFDYLAAGKPILVNYPGWMSDLITTHQIGFAVPPDTPAAFADALENAAADADLAAKGARARALGESDFNRESLGTAFVDLTENTFHKDASR